MQISIKNPNHLPTIDYRAVEPLQGNLKDLTQYNYNKLKTVLEKRGFTVPLFIWRYKDSSYLMDGHQRHRVMLTEHMSDNGSHKVPYILIDGKNRKEAKAQLLEISSQFGTITQEGFDEFTDELDNSDFEDVSFDALQFVAKDTEEQSDEKDDKHNSIIIQFGDISQLDLCLIDIQEVCEKYESAQIRVRE